MFVASIDIGKCNFAYLIEEYELDKSRTSDVVRVLKCVDLTGGNKKMELFDICNAMTLELDTHLDLLSQCNKVLIERQMFFGTRVNPTAVKLAQHCASYFLLKLPHATVIDFGAYHKTRAFVLTKMTKPQRKKWCINKALEVLEARKDTFNIELIKKAKKKDDLCDVICQLEAYKLLLTQ